MSLPGISSTPPQPINGLIATRYTHLKKEYGEARAAASPASVNPSTDTASQLASSIAAALAQLGLTAAPGTASAPAIAAKGASESGDASAKSNPALAAPPRLQKAQQQVQQYQNVAIASSSLAQALASSSRSTASGSDHWTAVFQNVWTSLGATSETPPGASSQTPPGLQTFLQTLAQHVSESGIAGLRGMFVDTQA